MAFPIPVLVGSIAETASDGTIAIPNTTPPAVGDYLVAFIAGYQSGGSRNIGTTPTGWTLRQEQSGDDHVYAVFTKTAESADVSATDFTFTLSGTADVFTGCIVKVSNVATGSELAGSEEDAGTTSYTFTTNLTPTTLQSIIIAFYTDAQNSSGAGTLGSYASTPSLTWVELADVGANNGAPSLSFGVAYAQITGLTNITQRTATQSNSPSQAKSVALVLNGYQDASGTAALLAGTPVLFAPAASAGTSGSAALLESSPTIFAPTASEDSPTNKWTDEDITAGDWHNEDLP